MERSISSYDDDDDENSIVDSEPEFTTLVLMPLNIDKESNQFSSNTFDHQTQLEEELRTEIDSTSQLMLSPNMQVPFTQEILDSISDVKFACRSIIAHYFLDSKSMTINSEAEADNSTWMAGEQIQAVLEIVLKSDMTDEGTSNSSNQEYSINRDHNNEQKNDNNSSNCAQRYYVAVCLPTGYKMISGRQLTESNSITCSSLHDGTSCGCVSKGKRSFDLVVPGSAEESPASSHYAESLSNALIQWTNGQYKQLYQEQLMYQLHNLQQLQEVDDEVG